MSFKRNWWLPVGLPRSDQSGFICCHHNLYSVAKIQLAQNPRHMSFDRLFRKEELRCDFSVGMPTRDQPGDIELTFGQLSLQEFGGRTRSEEHTPELQSRG